MKGVKGKLLKKLKTIKSIGYLKPERVLQVNALDGYYSQSIPVARAPLAAIQEEPEIIDVTELMKDLDDQESMESDGDINDKENIRPDMKAKTLDSPQKIVGPLSEIDVSLYRRPELNSKTLFDPNLLAAFEQAVSEVKAREAAERRSRVYTDSPPLKSRKITDPLKEFEERCPPGGSESVILYTTSLRGIRKTFEDCQKMRSLLENLRVLFVERDISMHSEFKEEMWRVLGRKIVPPRLFIKGRYIGGADEVLGLHEQGKLKPLIEGIPVNKNEGPCEGCVGFRFIVCFNCNGSRRIVPEGDGQAAIDCKECNENGVIICPFCC
ncbi:hypothetical protein CASFOL_006097 [Castilleja foliolosa]|uniref:Glutaredoxin domain-containing protein n=1 Tax=Castilleja foliolosa TaxID=1961234 RepID=A0ABD3E6B3_9LAMI